MEPMILYKFILFCCALVAIGVFLTLGFLYVKDKVEGYIDDKRKQ